MTNIVTPEEVSALLQGLETGAEPGGPPRLQAVEANGPPASKHSHVHFNLAALLPGSLAPCPVMLEASGKSGLRLLPALNQGQKIPGPWLEALLGQGIDNAYVAKDDLALLQTYLRQIILSDRRTAALSEAERRVVVYEHALAAVKSAMLRPADGTILAMGADTVRDMVDQITDDDNLLRGLLQIMSGNDLFFGHAINVCLLGLSLAKFLGWSRSECQSLAIALFFHDLGMMKIPRGVLNKPDSLSQAEWQLVEEHPQSSVQYLYGLPEANESVLDTIRNHHENLDGSGYPRGLTARHLTRHARVARIADVYDAITSHRAWRDPLSPMAALSFMRDEMGRVLDQGLLTCFIAALGERPAGKNAA